MTNWLLVLLIVASTTAGDVLQSYAMKRCANSSVAATAAGVFTRPLLLVSIVCMAFSFFSFLLLLRTADLSFAVPATAASFVLETLLARTVLKEGVDGRRWAGSLLVAAGVALLAM